MKLGGCEVFIKCDGVAMEEFRPTVSENGERISCYIPSQPGKEFSIKYTRDLEHGPPNTGLTIVVSFDGGDGESENAPTPRLRATKISGKIQDFVRGRRLHKFAFAKPEIIEGETPSSVDPDRIGEILVRLVFTTKSGRRRIKYEADSEPAIMGSGPIRVNERDKKLGAHRIVLKGLPDRHADAEPEALYYIPEVGAIEFMFQCRSEEVLRAEAIMPRSSPEPAEELEVASLPKSEPVEETTPPIEIPMGGAEVISVAGSPPRPRSPTPLEYAEEEQIAPRPTPQPTGRKEQPEIIFERPRKIAKKSGSFTFTVDSKIEGSSESKVKREKLNVKVEEIEEEFKDAIAKLREQKRKVKDEIASITIPRTGSRTKSPRRKMKAERGSTRLPMTPEVIDLTD